MSAKELSVEPKETAVSYLRAATIRVSRESHRQPPITLRAPTQTARFHVCSLACTSFSSECEVCDHATAAKKKDTKTTVIIAAACDRKYTRRVFCLPADMDCAQIAFLTLLQAQKKKQHITIHFNHPCRLKTKTAATVACQTGGRRATLPPLHRRIQTKTSGPS